MKQSKIDQINKTNSVPVSLLPSRYDSRTSTGRPTQKTSSVRATDVGGAAGGKKKKVKRPIWQLVESGDDRKAYFRNMVIEKARQRLDRWDPRERDYKDLLKNKLDITRTDRDVKKMLAPLPPILLKNKKKVREHNRKLDIFNAYFDGFESMEDYYKDATMTHPHWLRDLFSDSLELHVVLNEEIVDAFRRLSEFYDVNYPRMAGARAKVCLLMQSMPYYDVCRATVQRALDFVLRHVIKSRTPDRDMDKWLEKRSVVRVSLAPVSQQYAMMVQQRWSDTMSMKHENVAPTPSSGTLGSDP